MKDVSAPKSRLSEAAEGTIMSSVWVALLLALAGSSIDANGEFRWSSLLPGGSEATAAVAVAATPPTLAALPKARPVPEREALALAGDPCDGDAKPLGLCDSDSMELGQLGLPVASKDLSRAAMSATR